MQMKILLFILPLITFGCSSLYNLSDTDEGEFFLICQMRYVDNSGDYITSDDSALDELLKYGSTSFVTKTRIAGSPLEKCEIVNKDPINFEIVWDIKYSDKWRYFIIEPYQFSGKLPKGATNLRQVFVIEHPRISRIESWTAWKRPDFIGDLPETSFVLLGNNTEYLSAIKEPPYFEIRYKVVFGEMHWGVLTIKKQI